MKVYRGFLVLFSAAAALAATADLPYIGKWRANPAKSDFSQTTLTYEQTGPAEMKITIDGRSYTFRTDGKPYLNPYGGTAEWIRLGPNSWQTINSVGGKQVSTDTLKLSADGKTLTVQTTGTKADGHPLEQTFVFQRVSGGAGLVGKWRGMKAAGNSPTVFEIAPFETDGLKLSFSSSRASCDCKLDGKDYPFTGPTMPPGWTISVKKAGPRSFEVAQKQNGKAMYVMTFTVAADGKTMIAVGNAPGINEKLTLFYDRQ